MFLISSVSRCNIRHSRNPADCTRTLEEFKPSCGRNWAAGDLEPPSVGGTGEVAADGVCLCTGQVAVGRI